MSAWLHNERKDEWAIHRFAKEQNKRRKFEMQLDAANALTDDGRCDPDNGETRRWREWALAKQGRSRPCHPSPGAKKKQRRHGGGAAAAASPCAGRQVHPPPAAAAAAAPAASRGCENLTFTSAAEAAGLPRIRVPNPVVRMKSQLRSLESLKPGQDDDLEWWNRLGFFQVAKDRRCDWRQGRRLERRQRATYSGLPRYCYTKNYCIGGTSVKQQYIDFCTSEVIERIGSSHNGESDGFRWRTHRVLFKIPRTVQTLRTMIHWMKLLKSHVTLDLTHWRGFTRKEEFFVPCDQKRYRNVMNKTWPVNTWREPEDKEDAKKWAFE